jgi:hypothetical protein
MKKSDLTLIHFFALFLLFFTDHFLYLWPKLVANYINMLVKVSLYYPLYAYQLTHLQRCNQAKIRQHVIQL